MYLSILHITRATDCVSYYLILSYVRRSIRSSRVGYEVLYDKSSLTHLSIRFSLSVSRSLCATRRIICELFLSANLFASQAEKGNERWLVLKRCRDRLWATNILPCRLCFWFRTCCVVIARATVILRIGLCPVPTFFSSPSTQKKVFFKMC